MVFIVTTYVSLKMTDKHIMVSNALDVFGMIFFFFFTEIDITKFACAPVLCYSTIDSCRKVTLIGRLYLW